ncbi:MAG: M15 family metallopeptidase [Gloeobacterales cyanobacterium]
MKDFQEIPVASREASVRQTPRRTATKKGTSPLVWIGLGVGVVGIALGFFLTRTPSTPPTASAPSNVAAPEPAVTPTAPPVAAPSASEPSTLLGHHRYADAPLSSLTVVSKTKGKVVMLRVAAAEKFLEMQRAAARDGVDLVAVSGFRDKAYQQGLFDRNLGKMGQAIEVTKVSAPPGYSEHHTGYALDIGDGRQPETHVENTFEQTRAFEWLQSNAGRFGFEMSFPKDNKQGVSYEPWHWRFIGDPESLETFYRNSP